MARFPWVGMIFVVSALLVVPAGRAEAASPPDSSATPSLPDSNARSWQLGITRPDRLQHLSIAFTVGLGVGLLTRSAGTGLACGLGLGLAKELYDIPRTGFDVRDLAADAIGAGAAAALTAALQN